MIKSFYTGIALLKPYFLFMLLGIASSASLLAQSNENSGNLLVHQINSSKNNPRNSEGDFIELKDGRILFVYSRFIGGSGSDHAPAQLVGRYSADQGISWTIDDQVIVDREGDMNVMSVSLLRLKNCAIALVYARKNSLSDCIPQLRISEDEGKTWTNPKAIIQDKKGYFVVNNDRIVQLKSGRLLVPVSMHKTPETPWKNKGTIQCYYSDDNGLSWHAGDSVLTPVNIITQEPGLVELKRGKLMVYMRASGGTQYQSFSEDEGLTWTMAEPAAIPSPISPASIKKIPGTGDLLLVWNNNGASGPGYFKSIRSPLTIAVSKYEGKSWQKIKNIEEDPNGMFCYTAIHFTKTHVLLGYGVGLGLQNSYIRRLSLEWIYK
jgi:sialidase-1